MFKGIRPGRVRSWLEQLPLANVEHCSELVLEKLVEINSVNWKPKERIQVLMPFHSPLAFLHQALQKKYLNRSIPLSGGARRTAATAVKLQCQLAVGYRLAMESDTTVLDRHFGVRLVHGYLRSLGDLLLLLSQLYQPLPTGFWRQCHAAYRLASKYNVTGDSAEDGLSIVLLYMRLMVLGATDLRRFRQAEQSAIYGVLGRWCESLRISRAPLAAPSDMQVQFAWDGEHAPRRVGHADGGFSEGSVFCIDISPLNNSVRHRLLDAGESEEKAAENSLDDPCLRRLLRIWEGPWRRQFPRSPAQGKVEITIGLGKIHHQLSNESGDSIYQRANFKAEDGAAQWIQPGDPWARTPYVANDELESQELKPTADRPKANWQLIDSSAGGVCIGLKQGTEDLLRIGDLLYLTIEDSNPALGVVRWLQCDEESPLEVGVQILATDPEPVAVSPARLGSTLAPAMRLPENRAIQMPTSLVTPQYPFSEGMAAKIFSEHEEVRIRLVRMIETTGAYTQFRFDKEPLARSAENESENEAVDEDMRLWPRKL